MSDYDYLNARVRGMSTDLLSPAFYDQVLANYTDTILMDALLGSAYSDEVQKARALHSSRPVARAVEMAVWWHAASTFARLREAAPPAPRRLLSLQLNRWDVANVAALVRARLADAEPHEGLRSVLPIGEMDASILSRLAAEPDLEGLAEALPTGDLPIGFELRRAIRECPQESDPRALERCLYEAYFTWALGQLRARDLHEALVRDSIRRHIDLMNVIAILSWIKGRTASAGAPAAAPRPELVPRGMLDNAFLHELFACQTLEDAFEALASSYFSPGVEKGILTYGQSQSLGVMQRFLETVVAERACRLFRRDMLSAAVPLGFIWRKYSECVNLRLLARGILYRIPANTVRLELVLE